MSFEELRSLAARGTIHPQTLVWTPGYPEWIPADKVAGLLSETPVAPDMPAGIPTTVDPPSPLPPGDLKPRKGSFIFPKLVGWFLVSCLAGGALALGLIATEQPPWPGLAVFAFGVLLGIVASLAAYRKERYLIESSRLIRHEGGLVSDQTTELEIRNITFVKIKFPWLRFKLFGIGDVIVESAGTSKPLVMRCIREPQAVYDGIRELMKQNGYELTRSRLLHEEKPAVIGIVGECVGAVFATGIFGLIFLGNLAIALEDLTESTGHFLTASILGIAILALVCFVILRFLDLRRRTYRVFNDTVVYEEGFLTRENAFIPYENLADSNTKRSFIDRILNLYDVHISCQGSGSEIKFRRLRGGILLSAAIDHIVLQARRKPKPRDRSLQRDPALVAKQAPGRAEPDEPPAGDAPISELGMHGGRVLVPLLLLLPLFPVWILAMLQAIIRLTSTRYSVRMGSLRQSFRFFTVTEQEFAYDKITGLVIKRNLWDRMFNTMTLKFWSIGSGKSLVFAHVGRDTVDLPALTRQIGISAPSSDPYNAKATFSVSIWLRAKIYGIILTLFATGIIAAVATQHDPAAYYLLAVPAFFLGLGFLHSIFYYPRQRLRFHAHHVEAEQGIIAKHQYYVRYKNIKRTLVTTYPGGGEGELKIFVAGEEVIGESVQRGKHQRPPSMQCHFSSGMLPAVAETGLLLDDILSGRAEPTAPATPAEPSEVIAISKRSAGLAVLRLVLLSVLLFPLLPFLLLTVPLTILLIRRWRYRIEDNRVVISWGLLFRKETSVLLDRVDSLQQSQGPLNKLFKNGNVALMTAGSSKPDLVISDSPAYRQLYDEIRARSH